MAKYNNTFWRKWLYKYKSYKCLWDPLYINACETTSDVRLQAWNVLIEMAKAVDEKADANLVRSCLQKYIYKYKLEAKKVKVALANGLLYEPTAFYYKVFKSIHEVLQPDGAIPEANEAAEDVKENLTDEDSQPEKKYDPFPDRKTKMWLEVIERYTSFECLWDVANRESYTDQERVDAWHELLKLVKPFYELANFDFLKKKFKTLRTTYRREARRMAKANEDGLEYETKFIYFDLLTPIYQSENFANDNSSDEEKAVDTKESKADSSWSQERVVWQKMLRKYVSLKCLWDHKKNYSREDRHRAWLILLKMSKEFYPDADMKFVKKKINTYRTNFRRELNKIQKVNESGSEYTSHLFYMDILAPIYQSDCELIEDSSDENDLKQMLKDAEVEGELDGTVADSGHMKRALAKCTRDLALWRKFIKKYVAFDCLWDKRYVYKQKERTAAWQELLKFVKSSYPIAHMDYIRKRIHTFRAVFEKERDKILNAKERGIDQKPELFFYDIMRPMYDLDGAEYIGYESDESTNDSETDLYTMKIKKSNQNPKYAALQKELESLGYICGRFDTEYLSTEQRAWLMVIKKYVTFKCLWDPNRDDYSNNEREVAWHELLGMVQQTINFGANLNYLRNRINIFRTNYLRNFRKAKSEIESGMVPDVTLWYFNAVSPIYQEGFPIILTENEDLQPEETLNPASTTYFPDDDENEEEKRTEIKVLNESDGTMQDDCFPIDGVEILKEEQAEEEFIDDEIFLDANNTQPADDENSYIGGDEYLTKRNLSPIPQPTIKQRLRHKREEIPQSCDSNEIKNRKSARTPKIGRIKKIKIETQNDEPDADTDECEEKSEQTIKQKLPHKKEIPLSNDSDVDVENERSVQFPKFGNFQTFETKIAAHLDTMECEQYLLAEKLISDVCLYGRLGKLTIESGFKVKNV